MIQGTFITVIEFELYKICLNTFKFRIAIQKTSDRKNSICQSLHIKHSCVKSKLMKVEEPFLF